MVGANSVSSQKHECRKHREGEERRWSRSITRTATNGEGPFSVGRSDTRFRVDAAGPRH